MTYYPTCVECGNFFETVRYSAKFCSQTCSNVFHGRKRLESSPSAKICLNCNVLLPSNNFSLVDKNDASQGRRSVCKHCRKNLSETLRRNRNWKHKAALVLLNGSKQRAKRSGLEHTLTLDDIEIPDVCPVFGTPLQREDIHTWNNAPSIDRIDNTKGYTKDNIIIISRRANILKKDASIDELIKLAKFYECLLSRRES